MDLLGTLDVDVKHWNLLIHNSIYDLLNICSIMIPMDLCMLQEIFIYYLFIELLHSDEIVMDSVLFFAPRLACCR